MSIELARFKGEEVPTVTSLEVAEAFGKGHKDVLKAIKNLDCSKEFGRRNFAPTSYVDSWNRKQKMYRMTRDGFMMLVMGFTGSEAAAVKEAYIKEFNAMEKALREMEISKAKRIAVRKDMTKALKESGEADRTHGHAYSLYTNLIYNIVLGMTAAEKKEQLGLEKSENLRDCLSPGELKRIEKAETMVGAMVDAGMEYGAIRDFLKTAPMKAIRSGATA